MKRFFAASLAAAMVLSMSLSAAALSFGDMVIKDDDDYYTEPVDPVAPGSTFWVFLEEAYEGGTGTAVKEPKNIKIEEQLTIDSDTGKEVKLLSVGKSPDRLKYGSGSKERGYYARVTVKSVSFSSYPEDGFDVTDFVLSYTSYAGGSSGDTETTSGMAFTIAYEDADDELDKTPKMFSFEKDDDVDIDLPSNSGTFTGVARKDFDIVASMSTTVNSTLLNKYPNADLQFFNGNGANFPVSSGKLTFNADSDDYLYQVGANNTLTDLSNTYSSSKKAFVVNTTTLGSYVISNTKLSATAAVSSSSNASSSTASSEYIGSTPIISNPQTGAAV